MNWELADDIEYNTIGEFQTSESNTPVYYIVQWTGNAYTLQEIYIHVMHFILQYHSLS